MTPVMVGWMLDSVLPCAALSADQQGQPDAELPDPVLTARFVKLVRSGEILDQSPILPDPR